ncbi:MAG: PP2C family protein-serine/threonine phosphatase [Chitinophagales bacterium]
MLVASETKNIERLLAVKNGQLKALLDITNAISNNATDEELFQLYEEISKKHLSVQLLALYVYDQAWKKAVCINAEDACKSLNIAEIVSTYSKTGVLSNNNKDAYKGFKYVIPIYHENQPIALALAGTFNEDIDIEEKDSLDFAQTITSIITIAVENQRLWKKEKQKLAMDKELEVAAHVQKTLVPSKLPKNTMYEFAGFYLPHKSIGGDYYDVININRDEIVFCIADISGKGVAAALVMANLQAYLNAIEQFDLEDPRFIQRLNYKVFSITNGDKFITLFIAKYNIITRELTYINAGHNLPILMKDDKEILLKKGCTILGAMEEIPFITFGKEKITKGSTIVCYTDGLTELEDDNGKQYSFDRLRLFTQRNYQLSPEIFIKSLNDNLAKFKGSQLFNDDISLLTCKFL